VAIIHRKAILEGDMGENVESELSHCQWEKQGKQVQTPLMEDELNKLAMTKKPKWLE
jgi:hypothetical protein